MVSTWCGYLCWLFFNAMYPVLLLFYCGKFILCITGAGLDAKLATSAALFFFPILLRWQPIFFFLAASSASSKINTPNYSTPRRPTGVHQNELPYKMPYKSYEIMTLCCIDTGVPPAPVQSSSSDDSGLRFPDKWVGMCSWSWVFILWCF